MEIVETKAGQKRFTYSLHHSNVCVLCLDSSEIGFHVSFLLLSHLHSCPNLSSVHLRKRGLKRKGGGGQRLEEKTDYLGRLGEPLTEILLDLLQPAVGLENRKGRGECEKEICRQTGRDTKKGSCEIESSVRKCTCQPPNLPKLSHTHLC